MSNEAIRRFTAISGLLACALYVAAAATMAELPGVEASASQLHRWVQEHRTLMLAAAYVWGLCTCATLCFLAGLWNLLKEKSPTFAVLGLAGGFSIYAVALAGFGFELVAAYRIDSLSPETTKLLNDLTLLSVCLTGFPTALSMAGSVTAMFQQQLFPPLLRGFGILIALVHLISGGAFAASGLLSPSGIGVYVAPVLYYLWIGAISVWLLRKLPATSPR
jgi:hypothetical protein